MSEFSSTSHRLFIRHLAYLGFCPSRSRRNTRSALNTPFVINRYEEQMRGWLSYAAKAQSIEQQVEAYKQLKRQLINYCVIPILDFDREAVQEFQRLKKLYPRLGAMDLKIPSVALVNPAVLLTKNSHDFGQIGGLFIENWT